MKLPEWAGDPFHAVSEIGELRPDIPQLTRLEQGVNPPQAAPHSSQGLPRTSATASTRPPGQPVRRLCRGRSKPAAGPGARPRARPGRPRTRPRPARPATCPARSYSPRYTSACAYRAETRARRSSAQTGAGEGLLADTADLTVPLRYAGGLHYERRAGQPEPVTPALGPPSDAGRHLLRSGQVPAAVQDLGQGELEPEAVVLADLRVADRQRLPVQAHGLLERQ